MEVTGGAHDDFHYEAAARRAGTCAWRRSATGRSAGQVVDAQLDRDDEGPFLSLTAERDFAEVEDIPDHDLEHELAEHADDSLPEEAEALIARAARENLELELVVLDPGEEPSWDDAARFLEALILDEIEDDLLESSGRIATRASSHRSAGSSSDRGLRLKL
jgi:hypothetical protein